MFGGFDLAGVGDDELALGAVGEDGSAGVADGLDGHGGHVAVAGGAASVVVAHGCPQLLLVLHDGVELGGPLAVLVLLLVLVTLSHTCEIFRG